MILKALYDYYHRSGNLPPMGFERKEICFIIVIDEDGNFKRIEDTRDDEGTPMLFVVPRGEKRSGTTPKAQLLWDNIEYVLAVPKEDNDSAKGKAQEKNKAFVERCRSIADAMHNVKEFQAICAFYEKGISQVETASNWNDVLKERTRNISFRLESSLTIIPSIDKVEEYLSTNDRSKDSISQYCLVTGEKKLIVRLTAATPIRGSKSTAGLITFKEDKGYDSYGKTQCYNAPISVEAEFYISTAINTLLSNDSRNKFTIGDRTFLFWASKNDDACSEVENSFFDFLGNANADNPNANIAEVKELWKSIWSGIEQSSTDSRFYMLGLAPNAARIAVVYWNECSLKEFAGRILQHFADMEIVDIRKEKKPYMGIYSMLSAVTLEGNPSDVQPNLPEAVLKSIVQGLPYPFTLYSSCIRRINAEMSKKDKSGKLINSCTIARMGIIKAYLNRLNNNEIHNEMDINNLNVGYLCGRLFAVLDRKQEKGSKNNSGSVVRSIKERYMSAASTTPAVVFSRAINLARYYEDKLKARDAEDLESILQEILTKMPTTGFPAHLDLQDQGRFFVGYYQQRAHFFKDDDNK